MQHLTRRDLSPVRAGLALSLALLAACGSGLPDRGTEAGANGTPTPGPQTDLEPELSVLQFRVSESAADEGSTLDLHVVVEVTPPASKDLVVPFAVSFDGIANPVTPDFLVLSDSLSGEGLLVPEGASEIVLELRIEPDEYYEDDETIVLTLGAAPEGALRGGRSTHEHTIRDDDEAPTIRFALNSMAIGEANGMVHVPVSIEPQAGRAIELAIAVEEVGGITSADYSLVTVAVVEAHVQEGTFALELADDDLFEGAEGLVLRLLDTGEGHPADPVQLSIAIVDDEGLPQLSLGSHQVEWDEADTVVSIPVMLSAGLSQPLEVDYLLAGVAQLSSDYELLSAKPLLFAPGANNAVIELRIEGDTLHEADETLTVALLPPDDPSAAQLDGLLSTATELVIRDNDEAPEVAFTHASAELSEGDGSLIVEIELLEASAGRETRVEYALILEEAEALDFNIEGSEFVFLEGEQVAQILIVAIADMKDETDLERLRIELVQADHAVITEPSVFLLDIRDVDEGPTLSILAPDGLELHEGGGSLDLYAKLSSVSEKDVEVSLGFAGSSAALGQDGDFVVTTPMPLEIKAGEEEVKFVIRAVNDEIYEGNEGIQVSFKNPVNAMSGGEAAIVLKDDELQPTMELVQSDLSLSELTGSTALEVKLSHPSAFQSSALVSHKGISGDPATSPADYVVKTTEVEFAPGSVEAGIELEIGDDNDDEANESFEVSLYGASGAILGNKTVQITVIDDDEPLPIFADGGFESLAPGSVPSGAWKVTSGSGHVVRTSGAVVPATRAYWTETTLGDIDSSDLMGGDKQHLSLSVPRYLDIDEREGLLFWSNKFPDGQAGFLSRSDLDGENYIANLAPDLASIWGVAVEPSARRLYLCISGWPDSGQIVSTDYNGGSLQVHVEGLVTPLSIAIDPIGAMMYWAGDGLVQRANLDGTNQEVVAVGGALSPSGIALDPVEGKIYWTAGMPWGFTGSAIERSNLDGSNREVVLGSGSSLSLPPGKVHEIEIDPYARRMYWTHFDDPGYLSGITRARLDGSEIEPFVSTFQPSDVKLLTPGADGDHGVPSEGLQWVELEASQSSCGGSSGLEQSFTLPPGSTLLELDTAVLAHLTTGQGLLVVDISDGSSTENLLTRSAHFGSMDQDSLVHAGYRISAVEHIAADLAALFEGATSETVFTLSLQVSSCPGGMPAKAYVDDVRLELGNVEPEAAFSMSPDGGVAPLPVEITDESTGSITGWSWSVDGDLVQSLPGVLSFDEPGDHSVALSVSGPAGTDFVEHSVHVVDPLTASFYANPAAGTAGSSFQFFNTTTGYNHGSVDYSVSWSFGGGGFSSEWEPAHVFAEAGSHVVRLTVQGPYGLFDHVEHTIEVQALAPVASFTIDTAGGVAPLLVTFENLSLNATQALWDFGTGSFQQINATQFSKTFFETGSHSIVLKVDGPGGSDTQTQTIHVKQGFDEVWDVLDAECSGCHSSNSVLPLTSSSGAWASMVNVPSDCNGKLLVKPGSTSGSFLLDKLDPKPTFNGSFVNQVLGQWKWSGSTWQWNGCKSSMPAVSSSQLNVIRQWILDGAEPPQ